MAAPAPTNTSVCTRCGGPTPDHNRARATHASVGATTPGTPGTNVAVTLTTSMAVRQNPATGRAGAEAGRLTPAVELPDIED